MITTGQLRIFAKEFIRRITRADIVQSDDIRWLKDKNGQFPRKLVWNGTPNHPTSTFVETPYLPSDTFIIFDIVEEKNIASERIGNKTTSMLPFRLIINIYGDACPDELQHLMASLHRYEVRYWLQGMKTSLQAEPDDYQILDGRENASWWKRRRIELLLNVHQEFLWTEGLDTVSIEEIKFERKIGDE